MFAVYDSKAEQYLAPFNATTLGLAERLFTDMVNTEGHQFNRHPEDYTLYKVGTWESETAELMSTEVSVIANGLQVASNGLPFLTKEA
jgi:hypothetical protein